MQFWKAISGCQHPPTNPFWETDFEKVGVLTLSKVTAEFSASAPVVHKNPPLMGPEIAYTTGAGEGSKFSRQFSFQ